MSARTKMSSKKPVTPITNDSSKKVPLAKYATPGTEALAEATVEALGNSNAVIMANHGIAAVGATLDEAFYNALGVEFTARINTSARILGTTAELPPEK
jgi:L-fuculose-phosphate aldolase